MRLLIFGNSGSGKSTHAQALAAAHALPHLDLDTIVWEPGRIAVPREAATLRAELEAFTAGDRWVVEGCYGELIEAASSRCTELVFLNPGEAACLANNQQRPWEPHKYASMQAQDAMFTKLQAWVRGYYTRDDAWSYAAHRALFDAFAGPKRELTTVARRDDSERRSP